MQASSKVRSEYFLIKVYDLLESIIRSTQSSRRGSNPNQRPTAHPFGKQTNMRNANMDRYSLHGMKMGATSSRSRQTSAPGYRLLEETRLCATRDVNNPLHRGRERRRRIWSSACLPNRAGPPPGHEPGWARNAKRKL